MSEVTIKGVTWCRVDGGWWCTSASRIANGYDADTALDEVVRLREENARLRAAIEEALDGWKNSTAGWRDANNRNKELIGKLLRLAAASSITVADLCPTGGANTADVMAVVARLRTAVEAQS